MPACPHSLFIQQIFKDPQPWATTLDTQKQQEGRQKWSPPSVLQTVLERNNKAVFEYWEFHMAQTIRHESDLMRRNVKIHAFNQHLFGPLLCIR